MFWQTQTSYEFGPFRVDTRERQLLRDGKIVPLRPKVFDILLMLVQNSGHILSKDDVAAIRAYALQQAHLAWDQAHPKK